MKKTEVSIGICAYNEEKNIQFLIESILRQRLENFIIEEIIVISDGSTDRTEEIVSGLIAEGRIKIIRLKSRCGKYIAINNFLESAKSDILILSSADLVLNEDAVEKLCLPFFHDAKVGMTGARAVPVNSRDSFLGYAVNLEWYLHHRLSLLAPKFGELVAFRNNLIEGMPPTLVDEEQIACLVRNKGYRLQYAPEAIVHNKGPESMKDFFVQRKRIYIGHLVLKEEYNYRVSTLGGSRIFRCLLKNLPLNYKKDWHRILGTILFEIVIRMWGAIEFYIRRENLDYKWRIAESTKQLGAKGEGLKILEAQLKL